ncbi:MAG: T9SS type A sorting domain-containing protein [Lewinellaceae bacterium]|nr:T9SS type A sorting domain-containing protein [Saprospiraceae bacterium]MCB9334385.1 T9SS type A sorting domain-containing protein [Lewinellaceae bacterium]
MRNKTCLLLAILIQCHSRPVFGQWIELTPFITPTFYNSAIALDGNVYFAGGIRNAAIANDKVEILNLATNTLTQDTLSVGRGGIMVAAHKGKIYFAGGFKYTGSLGYTTSYSNVDILDVATGNMTTKHLSVPRAFGSAVVIGDKILFAGGYALTGPNITSLAVVDILNTENGEWSVDSLSQPRGDLCAAVYKGRAYFCGGALNIFTNESTSRIDIYDPVSGWSIDSLSTARNACSAIAVGDYLLVAGGTSDFVFKYELVDVFNGSEWSEAYLSAPRCFMTTAAIGKKAYFIGGGSCNSVTFKLDESSNVVDVFDADKNEWDVTTPLTKNRIAHAAAAWNGKIAVGAGWRPEVSQFTGSIEVFTDSLFVSAPQGVFQAPSVWLSPNPASDLVNLKFTEQTGQQVPVSLEVYDMYGRVMLQQHFAPDDLNQQVSIDVSTLLPGNFLLVLNTAGGDRVYRRFVVVR